MWRFCLFKKKNEVRRLNKDLLFTVDTKTSFWRANFSWMLLNKWKIKTTYTYAFFYNYSTMFQRRPINEISITILRFFSTRRRNTINIVWKYWMKEKVPLLRCLFIGFRFPLYTRFMYSNAMTSFIEFLIHYIQLSKLVIIIVTSLQFILKSFAKKM